MTASDEDDSIKRPRASPLPEQNMPMFRHPPPMQAGGISSRSIKFFFAALALALIGLMGFFWRREELLEFLP